MNVHPRKAGLIKLQSAKSATCGSVSSAPLIQIRRKNSKRYPCRLFLIFRIKVLPDFDDVFFKVREMISCLGVLKSRSFDLDKNIL